jgi:NaMN:DMB phosphoribosyltransferase
VPTGPGAFEAARQFGRAVPDDEVLVGETVPGGTTTAMGVLAALGEPTAVSSSLPENPLDRKREVVEAGLEASGLDRGGAAGDPGRAVRRMGDPVLATAAGFVRGATETDTSVTLAGGTQMLAVAALLRHAGVEGPLPLATTPFVAGDASADVSGLAARLDVSVTVTDPGFGALDHPAAEGYLAGEAKEGVGMGGALALARRAGRMAAVRDGVVDVYDRLVAETAGGVP